MSAGGGRGGVREPAPYRVTRSTQGGRRWLAAVATRHLARGEAICSFSGREFTRAGMIALVESGGVRSGDDPFELDAERCILLPRRYLAFNHSCEPNAIFAGERDLVALADIAAGEEITYDYATNASRRHGYAMKFRCACGAASCRVTIGDLSTIPRDRLREYYDTGWLQDYIRAEARELLGIAAE